MSTIKYDKQTFQIISLFEHITKTKIDDLSVEDDNIIFVLQPGKIKKALGENAKNLKKLTEKLGKKIKLVEKSKDIKNFIKSYIRPLKVKSITENGDIITLHSQDNKTKGLWIGRNAQNLRKMERITKRYFPNIQEIKVDN